MPLCSAEEVALSSAALCSAEEVALSLAALCSAGEMALSSAALCSAEEMALSSAALCSAEGVALQLWRLLLPLLGPLHPHLPTQPRSVTRPLMQLGALVSCVHRNLLAANGCRAHPFAMQSFSMLWQHQSYHQTGSQGHMLKI